MSIADVSKAIRSAPYPLALAFAFGWMIDVSPMLPESLIRSISYTSYPHLIVTALAFAVVALLNERFDVLLYPFKRFVGFSAACFLCTAAVLVARIAGVVLPALLLLAFSVIVALYQALVIVSCLKALARFPMIECMVSLAAWQLFIALLRALNVMTSSLVVTLVAPIVVVACLAGAIRAGKAKEEPEPSPTRESKTEKWFPARLLIINVIVIFTIQILHGMSQGPVANLSYIGSFIAIAIVGLALIVTKKAVRIQQLYRASLVGLEMSIIVFAIGTVYAQWASSVLLDAAYALFSIFFITTLCNACQRNSQRSIRIFATAYLLEQIAALMGNTTSGFIGEGMQVLVLTLLAGLGAIAFLCLATDDDFLTAWNTSLIKPSFVDPMQYYYSLSQICSSVAMQYSLSPREGEVLLLLMQKKTATQISEELTVSTATVKSHVHHIYQKIGVHTKQELFDLFDV